MSKNQILSLLIKREEWSSEWRKEKCSSPKGQQDKIINYCEEAAAKTVFEPPKGLKSQVKGTCWNTKSKLQPETELSRAVMTVQTQSCLKSKLVQGLNDETTWKSNL